MAAMPRVQEDVAVSQVLDVHAGMSAEELYESLDPIPGFRVELLDGRLVMTPLGTRRNQRVTYRLVEAFWDVAHRNGWEILTPAAVYIEATRDRPEPDLVIAPPDSPDCNDHEMFSYGAVLVAEVVSPSSKHDDREHKPRYYALGEVPLYLLVDVEADPRCVTLFSDPAGGAYRSRTEVPLGGRLSLPEPFGMTLDTACLKVD
jgi:Uma2 family endonuclease